MIMRRFICFCLATIALNTGFAATSLSAENEQIGLQNPLDRTIVYCYAQQSSSAEQCAKHYESQGYVRLRDLPSKPANFDSLTVDTYPTRRWRPGELTPRW